MVSSCCYCGIPLQRATQYVAIADIILGILNVSLIAIQAKKSYDLTYGPGSSSMHDDRNGYRSSMNYRYRQTPTDSPQTEVFLPGLHVLPFGVLLAFAICHGIQLLMGIFLYIAAVNRHRGTITFWMIITALTALFTGLIFRLYEMLIVNEFSREIRQEQEVTYFHDQHQAHHVHSPHQHYNDLVPPIQPNNLSVISGSGNQGGEINGYNYNTIYNQPPMATPNQQGYAPGAISYYSPGNQQNIPIPAALQPPPQYDEVMNHDKGGFANSFSRF